MNLLVNYNNFFISSHNLLSGWISVTLLFFILIYNEKVKISFYLVVPITILLSILVIFMAYRSYYVTRMKEKEILKKKITDNLIILYPSYLSLIYFIITLLICLLIIINLIQYSYKKKN